MKRSAEVPATLLILTASMMTGCSSTPTQVRRCLDEYGNIRPDYECQRGGGYVGGGGVHVNVVHWHYGGSISGTRVSGGSRTMNSNAHVVSSSGTTIHRGGFSGSGGSFGG